MIGLDTNVLVRYLTQDDERQSRIAENLIHSLTPRQPGFVSTIALAETIWVLRSCYGQSREQVRNIVAGLVVAAELVIQDVESVRRALSDDSRSADLPDALIAAAGLEHGCEHTVTFDEKAADLPGMKPATPIAEPQA